MCSERDVRITFSPAQADGETDCRGSELWSEVRWNEKSYHTRTSGYDHVHKRSHLLCFSTCFMLLLIVSFTIQRPLNCICSEAGGRTTYHVPQAAN